MIRLKDILLEMAVMNPLAGKTPDDINSEVLLVIQSATDMGLKNPVLWRGLGGIKSPAPRSAPYYSHIMYITGDRTAFRGGNDGAKQLIQLVFGKENIQPVFCATNRANVQFFGQPAVVIFQKPYTIYQSTEIRDVMVYGNDADLEQLRRGAQTYQIRELTQLDQNREVLVDTTNYWALPGIRDAVTYQDVVDYLKKLLKTKYDTSGIDTPGDPNM